MNHLEIRQGEDGLHYVLNGEPVEPGMPLELLTLWGWRKGVFIPGEPPILRTDNGQLIPIEPGDQVRRA